MLIWFNIPFSSRFSCLTFFITLSCCLSVKLRNLFWIFLLLTFFKNCFWLRFLVHLSQFIQWIMTLNFCERFISWLPRLRFIFSFLAWNLFDFLFLLSNVKLDQSGWGGGHIPFGTLDYWSILILDNYVVSTEFSHCVLVQVELNSFLWSVDLFSPLFPLFYTQSKLDRFRGCDTAILTGFQFKFTLRHVPHVLVWHGVP